MPSARDLNKPGHITHGDILDDLFSAEEALEAKIKADLWKDLLSHIERLSPNQATLAGLLKIHQPDVSNLLRGKLSKFSTAKLISFAVRLNLDVQVKLAEPKKNRATLRKLSSNASQLASR